MYFVFRLLLLLLLLLCECVCTSVCAVKITIRRLLKTPTELTNDTLEKLMRFQHTENIENFFINVGCIFIPCMQYISSECYCFVDGFFYNIFFIVVVLWIFTPVPSASLYYFLFVRSFEYACV